MEIMYALAEHRDHVVRFDPLLLNGPPGSGRSYFAECLAEFIGAGSRTIHTETAQSSAALVGAADFWSNSKPGQLFNMLSVAARWRLNAPQCQEAR
ncbi:ATP-binding protein [Noviherbaspirillum aerium]|uniref:hypothetical protein n=1 Tax=Noviherbaspirillum aerium TaxID=2588497 RepID=UPI00124F5496|nr:hypothetical protein [Noviherbaspirillum aerium]